MLLKLPKCDKETQIKHVTLKNSGDKFAQVRITVSLPFVLFCLKKKQNSTIKPQNRVCL
jgi:hypothetical protein